MKPKTLGCSHNYDQLQLLYRIKMKLKMENVRYLSGHLFLAELSPCRKCYGIYHRRERSRSLEVCQPSLLFSLLSPG